MSTEYTLCSICGGVRPTRYLFRPTSETDPTPVPYPDTGAFPLCSCTTWIHVSEEQKRTIRKKLLIELTEELSIDVTQEIEDT